MFCFSQGQSLIQGNLNQARPYYARYVILASSKKVECFYIKLKQKKGKYETKDPSFWPYTSTFPKAPKENKKEPLA